MVQTIAAGSKDLVVSEDLGKLKIFSASLIFLFICPVSLCQNITKSEPGLYNG
ncbi:MAG: hypothetical protein ACR2KX_15415 [Chitinophagaceae bacterium]